MRRLSLVELSMLSLTVAHPAAATHFNIRFCCVFEHVVIEQVFVWVNNEHLALADGGP